MDMDRDVKEILHGVLENLTELQMKHFKWKLQAINFEGKKNISTSSLEKAAMLDVVDLLCGWYGEADAVRVCKLVLEKIQARDVAEKIREPETEFGSDQVPRTSAKDYRLRYINFVKEEFQIWKDDNSLPGEYDLLNNRYAKLIILDHHRQEKERKSEIMSLGREHSEIMSDRARSSVTIDNLFKPDKNGLIPQIVVLQGAAGIGKTMTARKIMLDWACGKLYQDRFDYVFYVHCRKMNLYTEMSIADIILTQWASKDDYNEIMRNEILQNPQKLLFIVDGLDELRFFSHQAKDHLCTDPRKKVQVAILLSNLLRKEILAEACLIITTRPTALEKLQRLLSLSSRYAEILGFSEDDREDYFNKFFRNEDQARQAFTLVKRNEPLFTMCFIPVVCWIICTVMKQQMVSGEGLAQTTNTLTAVYMLYLASLFKAHIHPSEQLMQRNWRDLCCLAADGIWKQEILFWKEEIKTRGLDEDFFLPLFLNENIFKRDICNTYFASFIHLSFQDFFAALSYLLHPGKQRFYSFVLFRGQSNESGKFPQDVITLLHSSVTSRPDLALTVRFLFGLLNEDKRMKDMKEKFGWKVSSKMKKILLKWVKKSTERKITKFSLNTQLLFECLYEIQDENFAKQALDHVTEVKLNYDFLIRMGEMSLAYCLKHCCNLQVLCLQYIPNILDVYGVNAKTEKEEGLHTNLQQFDCDQFQYPTPREQLYKSVKSLNRNLRILRVGCYGLIPSYGDLSSVLCIYPNLTELDLNHNDLGDSGMKLLAERLKCSDCKLQDLVLASCCLTAGCCEDLSSVLIANQTIRNLDVSNNRLGDSGIKLLCEALRNPDCKLQSLRLSGCVFTGAYEVVHVLRENQKLKVLDLSFNEIKDKGTKMLCKGLKDPNCKLEVLRLRYCKLTAVSCDDLASVLSANQNLKQLHLGGNELTDSGVKVLCEQLKNPACRLKVIGLRYCKLTAVSCDDLASVLSANQNLKQLHLGGNELTDSGVKVLCEQLKNPACRLKVIGLEYIPLSQEMVRGLRSLVNVKACCS